MVKLSTTLSDDAYYYMENFAKSVEDKLFKERLLEVLIKLADGLVDFVQRLQDMSEEEVMNTNTNLKLDCFIKMQIRLNDV